MAMQYSGWLSHQAVKLTTELNSSCHTPEEILKIFSELTGKQVDKTFGMFPPFYTDCGKNITVGKNVFINSGCRFQDQGGSPSGTGQTLHAEPGFSDRFENDLTHSPILGKMNNDGRRSVGKRIRCGFLCLERNEVFSWKIRLKTEKIIRIKGLPERAASA